MVHSERRSTSDLLFADLLQAFEFAVLERVTDAQFQIIGQPQAWLSRLYPTVEQSLRLSIGAHTQVLQNFLTDAMQAWRAEDDRMVRSGFWTEQPASEEP